MGGNGRVGLENGQDARRQVHTLIDLVPAFKLGLIRRMLEGIVSERAVEDGEPSLEHRLSELGVSIAEFERFCAIAGFGNTRHLT